MSDQLKQLEKEHKENQAVLDRTRPALAAAVREMDALGKGIYTLEPEGVAKFAADRRRLADAIELLGQIANYRAGRGDDLQRKIAELKLQEARDNVAKKNNRIAEILYQIPLLARNAPQRDDLEAELAELERS